MALHVGWPKEARERAGTSDRRPKLGDTILPPMTPEQQAIVLRYYRVAGSYALRRYNRAFRRYGTTDDLLSISALALCRFVLSHEPDYPHFKGAMFNAVRTAVGKFIISTNESRLVQAREDGDGIVDFTDRQGPDDLPDFPALCDGIPEDQAEALWCLYGRGLAPIEIAARMGVPPWKAHSLVECGRFAVKANARRLGVA